MNAYLYRIECLTNLHVGSGDVNYNIIDKEVERDPVTGYPTIHASGVKGALRKAYREALKDGETSRETELFGQAGSKDTDDGTGAVRFFNAMFLARPLRASGNKPSVLTTTVAALNEYVNMANSFCGKKYSPINDDIHFNENEFLCTEYDASVKVEGESTGLLTDSLKGQIADLLGAPSFALARSFDNYGLPVIARNNLTTDKGNLWYEEYVPHGSLFFEIVLAPDDSTVNAVIPAENRYVQIGGNASVGYGYCKFTRIG